MELRIRRFQENDYSDLHELLSDGEVMRYIEPPFAPEQTAAFLKRCGLSEPPLIYAVDDEGGCFIGYIIYHDYGADSRELGWILKRSCWGKGYAQALTRKLLERALEEGKALVLECAPEQAVTKHIAEKMGFSYMGRLDGRAIYKYAAP